jgi:hypothetical protein
MSKRVASRVRSIRPNALSIEDAIQRMLSSEIHIGSSTALADFLEPEALADHGMNTILI